MKLLGYKNITEALPCVSNEVDQCLLKNANSDISVYLNLYLNNSTSSSAIIKTLMVGNVPGLIEIPRQMYFNSSQIEYNNGHTSSPTIKLDEDNLLYRNIDAGKGRAIAVGKNIVQKGLRDLFNETYTLETAIDEFNFIKKGEENPYGIVDEHISILLVNYEVNVQKGEEDVRKRFEDINLKLSKIMKDLDDKTVLVVTGNKATKKTDNANLGSLNFKDRVKQRNDDDTVIEGDTNKVEDIQKAEEAKAEPIEVKEEDIATGLFIYSKRKPAAVYDYEHAEEKELFALCPNPKANNRLKNKNRPKTGDKYGTPEKPDNTTDDGVFLQFFNTFSTLGGSQDPDHNHILNVTSTLSNLLGLSIPYSNIGSIIPHSFLFENHKYCSTFYKSMLIKYTNNLKQIREYRERYYHSHVARNHIMAEDDDLDRKNEIKNFEDRISEIEKILKGYEKSLQVEKDLHEFYVQGKEKAEVKEGKERNLEDTEVEKAKAESEKGDMTLKDDSNKTETVNSAKNETKVEEKKTLLLLKPSKSEVTNLVQFLND